MYVELKGKQFYNLELENDPKFKAKTINIVGVVEDGAMSLNRWKAVLVPATKKVVSIVSSNYNLVQHADIIKALKQYNVVEPDDIVKISTNDDFTKFYLTIRKPITKELEDSKYSPLILITNSYNKELAINIRAGLYRWICSNGMFFGVDDFNKRIIHTSYDAKYIPEFIAKMNQSFDKLIEVATKYMNIKTDVDKVIEELEKKEMFKKYVKRIKRKLGGQVVSVFDLYNELNTLVNHDWKIKPHTKIDKIAKMDVVIDIALKHKV